MSKRAEIIKKDVILITTKGVVDFIKNDIPKDEPNIQVNIEYLNECRLYNGTHSIKRDRSTYYCKDEDYYCAINYCLILDLSKKEEALENFFTLIRNKYNSDIQTYEESISKLRKTLNRYNEIENETTI